MIRRPWRRPDWRLRGSLGTRRPLFGAGQLALEVGDVVLVQLDLLLVGLEPFEDALVIALAAQALRLLVGQVLARLVEELLLVGELLVEYLAPVVVALLLRIGVHTGEVR